MGNILVIAEQSKGSLKKASLSAVTFAKSLAGKTGGECHILVMGSGIDAVAKELAGCGAKKVWAADNPGLNDYLAPVYAQVAAQVAKDCGATVVTATVTAMGKDLLPRVAAKLVAGMLSDIIDFSVEGGNIVFKKPVYAGSINALMTLEGDPKVVSVRGTAFEAAKKDGAPAEIAQVSVSVDPSQSRMKFVSFEEYKSVRPELTEASVVVSGGRGLKSAENFKIIEGLADLLGGAVGATRAAVDSGFCPNDLQVGQTGKVVAPSLYIAIAISGAIQHLAGMKDSKVIVAINKDPEAPIFQVADYGIVGDLFKAVPELMEEIKKAKA